MQAIKLAPSEHDAQVWLDLGRVMQSRDYAMAYSAYTKAASIIAASGGTLSVYVRNNTAALAHVVSITLTLCAVRCVCCVVIFVF